MTRRSSNRTYQCALLTVTASGWFTDLLCTCSQLKLSTISERGLGLKEDVNPYRLSLIEKPDVILICMNWYAWLAEQGEAVVDRVFARLRSRCPLVVGLEGFDLFSLRMPPEGLDRIDLLLKAQGVYRDREFYNYEVGPYYPGANWTGKLRKSSRHYSSAQLDKIRLSLPCFVGIDRQVRGKVRRLKATINRFQRVARQLGDWWGELEAALLHRVLIDPPYTAHCLVALSHIQRLELLLALKRAGVTGLLGVSCVPEYIWGTDHFESRIPDEELETIRQTIPSHGLHYGSVSRNRFKRTMLNHKAVIAPAGYGEITFRHAEALEQGRVLICQDLSHVETMFPFKDRENVLFCRPDFSDIEQLLDDVRTGRIDVRAIGRRGREDWKAWIGDLDAVFEKGVMTHLDAVMHSSRSRAELEATGHATPAIVS